MPKPTSASTSEAGLSADTSPQEKAGRPKLGPGRVLDMLAIAACLPSLIGFLGGLWWRFELLSHFRVQYFFVLSLGALLLLILRRFKAAPIVGAVALINLAMILPLYFGRPSARAWPDPLRLVSINVLTSNTAYDKVCGFVHETDADFVLLEEIDSKWMRALKPLLSTYPYREFQTREDNFGIAVLSKLPFSDVRVEQDEETGDVPYIVADFENRGRPFRLVAVHALPPVSRECAAMRDRLLARLAQLAVETETPILIAGDFNTTSWSPAFHALLRSSDLHDSRKTFGVQPTWPSDSRLLRIPLDHCLVSPDVTVLNREVGPDLNSDHLPIMVEFVIAPSQ